MKIARSKLSRTPVAFAVLPLALACIMFYLGLTLVLADFRQVAKRPRALLVGLIAALKAPLFALLWAHERPGPGDTVRDADGGAGSDAVAGGSNKN